MREVLAVDLDHGQVGFTILPNHLGSDKTAGAFQDRVGGLVFICRLMHEHLNILGTADNVRVGHDIPFRVDHDTGSSAAARPDQLTVVARIQPTSKNLNHCGVDTIHQFLEHPAKCR
jgi:hypothetical protein